MYQCIKYSDNKIISHSQLIAFSHVTINFVFFEGKSKK